MATTELTKAHMNASKTQFYGGDGTGRDTYIYMNNGGFCPEKQPCKIEEIGKLTPKLTQLTICRLICCLKAETEAHAGPSSFKAC